MKIREVIVENDEEDMFGQSDRVGKDLRRVTFQQRIPSMVKMIQGNLDANTGPFAKTLSFNLGADASVFRRSQEIFDLANHLLAREVMSQVSNILMSLDPAVISDEDELNDALTDLVSNIRAESELWHYIEEVIGDDGADDQVYACAMTIEGELGALLLKLIQQAYNQSTLAENMDHDKDGGAVEELRAALVAHKAKLQSADDDQVYNTIDKMMTRIARSHSISGQKLHDMWVSKYKQIPDTWIMKEAFDQPYKTKSEKSDYGDIDMLAKLPDGSNLSIMFNQEYGDEGEEVVQVEFYRNNSQEVTGEGDAQRIFATVLDSIQKYIKKYKPQKLSFSASKEVDMDADNVEKFNPESRAKLYDRLVQRYSRAWGYRALRADTGSIVRYELSRLKQDVAEGESNDTAISLSKLGKFHPGADTLAEFVPERATAQYALHPDKWESTFYSLTNKDSDKLKYYGPKKISIPPGTLVGDMAIANKFYRAKTPEEQEQNAELYKASLQPYPVDVSEYRMPELLIPKQGVAENKADGINKMFNNLGDPVFANLQRVALLAMQGRQSEAAGRLQTVIKDADPAVQKKITDAVNSIKPVTINGRVADSSTLDKSKQHNDWIINTFIPWVQSLLGQQGMAENFADGRNPQDKGDSKRHGVPTKASISTLRKVAKQGGRKGQLAHWMANMKSGRAKAKK